MRWQEAAGEDGATVAAGRRVSLGSQPILLTRFVAENGASCVFAACDRPAVLYANENGKLTYVASLPRVLWMLHQ